MGKGREMGRSVYEQPENEADWILSQQGGFQVSKGRRKGRKKEKQKARGLLYNCTVIHIRVHNECLNDYQLYIYVRKIIAGYECSNNLNYV